MQDLAAKGVRVIETEEELSQVRDSIVIIRSHGVGRHIYRLLEENGNRIVDATCPFVKKIQWHRIADEQQAGKAAGSSSSAARNIRR